jgi:hypothetical protein
MYDGLDGGRVRGDVEGGFFIKEKAFVHRAALHDLIEAQLRKVEVDLEGTRRREKSEAGEVEAERRRTVTNVSSRDDREFCIRRRETMT